jgi:hypothetical protein
MLGNGEAASGTRLGLGITFDGYWALTVKSGRVR